MGKNCGDGGIGCLFTHVEWRGERYVWSLQWLESDPNPAFLATE